MLYDPQKTSKENSCVFLISLAWSIHFDLLGAKAPLGLVTKKCENSNDCNYSLNPAEIESFKQVMTSYV